MRLGAASFALSILANITCVFAAAPIGLTRVVAFLAVNNALPHGANGINIVLPLTYRAISGEDAGEIYDARNKLKPFRKWPRKKSHDFGW